MTYTTTDMLEYGLQIGLVEEGDTHYSLPPRILRALNAAYADHLEKQRSIDRMHSMLDSLGMAHQEAL